MKRLNAAGWMAVVVITFAVVSGGLWAVRTIQMRTQDISDLPTIAITPRPPTETPSPTETPRPTDTPTPEVALDPTPEGWTMETDLFTGDNYLAPPSEDEAQIRAAFEAVLALVVIEDRSNEEALEYALIHSWEDLLDQLELVAVPEIVERYGNLDGFAGVWLGSLGSENPVRCESYYRCTVGQVKSKIHSGTIIYDSDACAMLDEGIPEDVQSAGNFLMSDDGSRCVSRFVDDDTPREIYIVTVDKQEDGVWRVVDFQTDPMN